MKTLHTFSLWANTWVRPCILCLSFFILHSSFFIPLFAGAQNVAINTTGTSADPSAMLDVKSTTAGVLIPRMTTAQRNAISSPAVGLQIFNTDCDVLNYWTGTCWVSAGAIPAPDSISSNSSTALCVGATATYSIPAITGATAYYWQVPPGSRITSGQGATSITVTYGSYSGNVCVTANDACETSQPTCRQVNVTSPVAPGAITGTSSFCANAAGITYSIQTVSGASSYTWSVPSGSAITSGQGSNSITVTFGSTSGNISVYATSSCGNSSAQTLPVSLISSAPNTPGTISGNTYICNSTNQNYSISPVSGATSYTWQVPNGVTILSGQGTNSITVNYPSSGGGGNITVSATNSCGTSLLSLLAVQTTSLSPLAPGSITGATTVGTGSSSSYLIATINLASGYRWSVTPTSASISSGQGSPQVIVNFGTASSYTLCVYDSNGCGKSIASCLTITTGSCPQHGTVKFTYTGYLQNWAVPCGITSVTAYVWGAAGGGGGAYNGSIGGTGAFVAAALNVTGITTLNIIAGQGGSEGTAYISGSSYGGGGSNPVGSSAGTGGGRSAIQFNGNGADVLTAGGGGGGGSGYTGNYSACGGGGGNGTSASNGTGPTSGCTTNFGQGGTAIAGGAGGTVCSVSTSYNGNPGTQYLGGNVTSSATSYYGGAGGGGYYGGGSGGSDYGGGGGGGSSFPTSSGGSVTLILGPAAGTTESNNSSSAIYPPDYNTSPYSSYYVSGVGVPASCGSTCGSGEVVIIY